MTVVAAEQEALRGSVRGFLEKHCADADVRLAIEAAHDFDSQVWHRLAAELGLQGLGIPEELGGSAATWVEIGITFQEFGRVLNIAPYFATVALAIPALSLAGDEDARRAWLPSIASGDCVATVAIPGQMSGVGAASTLEVSIQGQSHYLTGRLDAVLSGGSADLLIVQARSPSDGRGATLYMVGSDAPGLTRLPIAGIDATHRFAAIECTDTPASILGEPGSAEPVSDQVRMYACVAVAAEAAGGARACLEMVRDYLQMRSQFGRRIGSFQSLKHRLADLAVAVESATEAAHRAAEILTVGGDIALVASLAKSYCCQVYSQAAAENIQLHGGIGFTWEHNAHLHYRKSITLENMFGAHGYHQDRVSDLLGI